MGGLIPARTGTSATRRCRLGLLVLLGILLLALPAQASAGGERRVVYSTHIDNPLKGGLELGLFAQSKPRGDGFEFAFAREGDRGLFDSAGSQYSPRRARVNNKGIKADFGSAGHARLRFRPRTEQTEGCVRWVDGLLRGRFLFIGEGEIPRVERRRIRASRLMVTRRCRSRGPIFGAATRRRSGPTVLSACTKHRFLVADRYGGDTIVAASIERPGPGRLRARHGALLRFEGYAGFRFARDLSSATLRPPTPFEGEARYANGELRGDLRVDTPGRNDLKLTASNATLSRDGKDRLRCGIPQRSTLFAPSIPAP